MDADAAGVEFLGDFTSNSSGHHTPITPGGEHGGMDSMPPPPPDTKTERQSSPLPLPLPVRRVAGYGSSSTLKLVLIAVLIGVLHVPLLLVWNTLDDRRHLRDEATAEIGRSWGAEQTIVGPVLAVPFSMVSRVPRQNVVGDRVVTSEEMREVKGTAYFLPAQFSVEGALDVSERNRGIFRTPVYAATLTLSGEFRPDARIPGLERAALEWGGARVLLGVSDLHGLRSAPTWSPDAGAESAFVPASPREGGWGGMEAAVALPGAEPATRVPFRINLMMQGSQRLALVPVGENNEVRLRGGWPDPSFDGGHLPADRTIGPEGFSARWITTHFGRAFPSAWADLPGREPLRAQALEVHALGVTLATPVDTYRMVERALKYALLVLVLVFAVFFLFETTSPVQVHPLQYLMVGGALVLFYLGFLALAEFLPVGWAYFSAASASTALIGGYSWSVLRAGAQSLLVGAGLAATYGYVYFMLQLKDYALLAGTAALFALLAAAMWFTRKLDWTASGRRETAKA